MCSQHGIWVAVGPLRIHIDEPHLHRGESLSKLASFSVSLVRQHLRLRAPVDPLWLPIIGAATGKSEGLEPHILHRHVARKDHQVSPRDLVAVLLLDRPQQTTRLVEVAVVGPAIQRFKSLLTTIGATTAIRCSIGACAMPGHTHKKRTVVAVISRPPWLRSC